MKKKIYKIGIWGQFGDGGPIADGQAVRTTITTNELKKRYGDDNVLILNTNAWKKHPIKFFLDTINLLKKSENILIFPADNGLKVVAQIYDIFNVFFKRKLFYIVIGGFLPAFLEKNPRYIKILNKYEVLFVQTPNLKKDLENLGIKNIEMMTNFKIQKIRASEDIKIDENENIKLCILSRLTKDKGIEDAVEAVKEANDIFGSVKVKLDLYGIVPEYYKERFAHLINQNKYFVEYKGVANYNQTVDVLKNYFALLFPTYFHGEGFAGCIIDAFFAGIPIIATDWLYNKDIVKDKKNGILVPIKNSHEIANAIVELYNNRDLVLEISKNNSNEAKKYTSKQVLKELFDYLDNGEKYE